jgi:alpha-acetolactate decarboxylase
MSTQGEAKAREKQLTAGRLLVRSLVEQNVKHIFGIPGGKTMPTFAVLRDEGPRLIVCRHEQNAAFMAAAVGRLTGKPGVCLVTSGPGTGNLVTGAATATTEGDPVVAIGGVVPLADALKQTHQSMDSVAIMKPVMKAAPARRPVTADQKTPFAVVTFFQPEQELDLVQPMTKSDLLAMIEKAPDANLFNAVRVDGIFDELHTRTVQRQARPFPPLTEAAKHHAEKVFNNVEGTLAGFRSPAYAQGIGVAGFRLHFLRKDKQAGGHALDYRLRSGKVQICTVHDLRVELPTSAEFLKKNFEDRALSEKIKAAEG